MAPIRSRIACGWLVLGLAGVFVASACGGSEFTGDGDASGGASSGGRGGSGSGGTSSGGGAVTACLGPDECNDDDACTVDECVQGGCMHSPRCAAGEACCDGVCGECCGDSDCEDGVTCTENVCFGGFCAFLPDDEACQSDQYCNAAAGCLTREPCPGGTAAECDDGNPCSPDTCEGGLCHHGTCSPGTLCCELGCAECCSNSQCAGEDDDPCTDNICQGGTCTVVPHCTTGTCCEGLDGSASCGQCCRQEDCQDDFECTVDSCTVEGCKHVADDSLCQAGQVCSVDAGCVSVSGCTGCTAGQVCCDGQCRECCTPEDCIAGADPTPLPGCQNSQCINHQCMTTYELCGDFGYVCCAPYGCFLGGCPI